MGEEQKWYIIKGVKPPVYVGLIKRGGKKLVSLLYLLLALFMVFIFIAEPLGIVPQGLSIVILMFLIVGQGILSVLPIRSKSLSLTDQRYIRGLLETIKNYILRWSIPSNTVPVAIVLNNGLYMYVYYNAYGRLSIMLIKPTIYLKIIHSKPIVKVKFVKKLDRKDKGNREIKIGIADAVLPHPEIRGMNIHVRGRAVQVLGGSDHKKILEVIRNFDKLSGGGELWL